MKRKPAIRVYADTSVFGGVCDAEFERATRAFFEIVRAGRFSLVTSALVEDELRPAPTAVKTYFEGMLPFLHRADVSQRAIALRTAYMNEGIVGQASVADALHVAIASVSKCPVLVSWNCRHIVHFQKIPRYNAVNRRHGLAELAIHTPLEVSGDES